MGPTRISILISFSPAEDSSGRQPGKRHSSDAANTGQDQDYRHHHHHPTTTPTGPARPSRPSRKLHRPSPPDQPQDPGTDDAPTGTPRAANGQTAGSTGSSAPVNSEATASHAADGHSTSCDATERSSTRNRGSRTRSRRNQHRWRGTKPHRRRLRWPGRPTEPASPGATEHEHVGFPSPRSTARRNRQPHLQPVSAFPEVRLAEGRAEQSGSRTIFRWRCRPGSE